MNPLLARLRYHVSGAIERGESAPIVEKRADAVTLTIRRDKETNRAVLFFYTAGALNCYDRIGQHSSASIEYMRQRTAPISPDNLPEDARALVREWQNLGGYCQPVRIVRRLMRE